ncbi:hypothetical protein [Halorussus caseinilyticus]|uniref:Uncharacterized protein n=1 Tax=Halorussus caseinilyticus TaxID=3034025 RepID=A0ABD5WLF4_9EURY|nr:hypothetical protein [Halorussus sp. DT72]
MDESSAGTRNVTITPDDLGEPGATTFGNGNTSGTEDDSEDE